MSRRLLTPSEVRRLLAEHAVAPRKAHGQNFVVDPNTVRKVVRDAGVSPGDLVCEVGPGLGSLTLALREAGARVVAIEVDSGLVEVLRHVVGDDPDVVIHHADALRVDYRAVLGAESAVLVANLPYNIATPLVIAALKSGAFSRLLVMVQREVGQRWVAGVGDAQYGGVSVKIAAMAAARVVSTVSRMAFYPVPNVDSVTVALEALSEGSQPDLHDVDRQTLFGLVDLGFGQRRKRLRNALATPQRRPEAVESALRRAGLAVGARAEELDLAEWVRLACALQ